METLRNLVRFHVESSQGAVQRHCDRVEEVEKKLYQSRKLLAHQVNYDEIFLVMRSMDTIMDELINARRERIIRVRSLSIGQFKFQLSPKYRS